MNTFLGIGLSTESNDNTNKDTPVGVTSVKEGLAPYVVDMMVEMEKISSLKDTTVVGSFPPLSTLVIIRLVMPLGNGIDVVVLVESIRAISKRFDNTTYGFFLGKWVAYHVVANYEDGLSAIATKLGTPLLLDSYTSDTCMQSWGRSSYARVMIELQVDVELKDNILAMPKNIRESHYICVCEKKTLKKPNQTSRGVSVNLKKNIDPFLKKSTASSSGNTNEGVVPTIEVSNSNPFEVLNSVNNVMEQGTNGGTTNLKFKELLTSGKATLVDDAGFGTQSLLEQWRDSYDNGDYDDDPYDDDIYEGQDLSLELQAICDNLT
nr:hypothetical protein [Tanacetum cinerariifolium]GEZ90590.1 hypothetical protein [Tanacetum cinerariifolium]